MQNINEWCKFIINTSDIYLRDIFTGSVYSNLQGKYHTKTYLVIGINQLQYDMILYQTVEGERKKAFSQLLNHLSIPIRKFSELSRSEKFLVFNSRVQEEKKNLVFYCTNCNPSEIEPDFEVQTVVSEKHTMINNSELLNIVHRIAGKFDIVKESHNDNKSVYQLSLKEFMKNTNITDPENRYGLQFENSYNASACINVKSFSERLVCTNGLVIKGWFSDLKRKHLGNKQEILDLFEYAIIDKLDDIYDDFNKIQQAKMSFLNPEYNLKQWVVIASDFLELPQYLKHQAVNLAYKYEEGYLNTVWSIINTITDAAHHAKKDSTRLLIEEKAGDLLQFATMQ